MLFRSEIDIVPAIAPENFRKLPSWKLGQICLVCILLFVLGVVDNGGVYCVVSGCYGGC